MKVLNFLGDVVTTVLAALFVVVVTLLSYALYAIPIAGAIVLAVLVLRGCS